MGLTYVVPDNWRWEADPYLSCHLSSLIVSSSHCHVTYHSTATPPTRTEYRVNIHLDHPGHSLHFGRLFGALIFPPVDVDAGGEGGVSGFRVELAWGCSLVGREGRDVMEGDEEGCQAGARWHRGVHDAELAGSRAHGGDEVWDGGGGRLEGHWDGGRKQPKK